MCGKMYLLCVCVSTCGENSDLELTLHKYPSLYRLILVKTEYTSYKENSTFGIKHVMLSHGMWESLNRLG